MACWCSEDGEDEKLWSNAIGVVNLAPRHRLLTPNTDCSQEFQARELRKFVERLSGLCIHWPHNRGFICPRPNAQKTPFWRLELGKGGVEAIRISPCGLMCGTA